LKRWKFTPLKVLHERVYEWKWSLRVETRLIQGKRRKEERWKSNTARESRLRSKLGLRGKRIMAILRGKKVITRAWGRKTINTIQLIGLKKRHPSG